MAVRTITIKEEAYRRLKHAKRRGESFSDVIIRVVSPARITDFIGILSLRSARRLRRGIRRLRREADLAHEKRLARLRR